MIVKLLLPRSQNVSHGSDIVFSCGTNDSSLDIIWFVSSKIAASDFNQQLVEGGSVSKVHWLYWYIGALTNRYMVHWCIDTSYLTKE